MGETVPQTVCGVSKDVLARPVILGAAWQHRGGKARGERAAGKWKEVAQVTQEGT